MLDHDRYFVVLSFLVDSFCFVLGSYRSPVGCISASLYTKYIHPWENYYVLSHGAHSIPLLDIRS